MNNNCKMCGKTIPEKRQRRHAIYCSEECLRQASKAKYDALNPTHNLNCGTIGAISELKVVVDLLKRGYEVFRAVSPASPCDLALLKDCKLLRVEVKTGHYYVGGGIYKHRQINPKTYDILAIVLPDKIIYEPPLGHG